MGNSLQSTHKAFKPFPWDAFRTLLEGDCRPVLLHSARREPTGKTRTFLYAHPVRELAAFRAADCAGLRRVRLGPATRPHATTGHA